VLRIPKLKSFFKTLPPRTTKLGLAVRIIVLLVIVLFCIALCYAVAENTILHQPTGEEEFRGLVLDPMPKSVIVLQYQDGDDCCETWLHFKISPIDFNYILTSSSYWGQKWKVDSDFDMSMTGGMSDAPKWWSAQFGNNATEYSLVLRCMTNDQGGCSHEEIEYMWVNPQRNEVYLFDADTFPH
jgi:hypothetical protein